MGPPLILEPNQVGNAVYGRIQVILRHPQHRVNELSEESRLLLLRLAEQVSQMTARLERLLPPSGESDDRSAFRLESPFVQRSVCESL